MKLAFKILKKEEFLPVYRLMQEAFQPAEFRRYEEGLALFDRADYRMLGMEENGNIQAFIAEWAFPTFRYVEHFAVNPDARGSGLGTKMMREYVKQGQLPVVIEVEAEETVEAKRRINFYERLGFTLSDMHYFQPLLQRGAADVLLRLMVHAAGSPIYSLDEIKEEIFQTVYDELTGQL